jgi:dolichol-phosphate mannosyltransferase
MLSIIIPTYNEAKNIGLLIERVFAALGSSGIAGELVVVDDNSPDGTAAIASGFKGKYNVVVKKRSGKKGLASAVIDGLASASGEILCVMDADLSHSPHVIPMMYKEIINNNIDLVIGSRLVAGGGSTDWSSGRKAISSVARMLSILLTGVKDSTSGYFMMKKSVIEGVKLNPIGFKIGLEIIVKGNYNKIKEVPIVFLGRVSEKSKLGIKQVVEYLFQVILLYCYLIGRKILRKGRVHG